MCSSIQLSVESGTFTEKKKSFFKNVRNPKWKIWLYKKVWVKNRQKKLFKGLTALHGGKYHTGISILPWGQWCCSDSLRSSPPYKDRHTPWGQLLPFSAKDCVCISVCVCLVHWRNAVLQHEVLSMEISWLLEEQRSWVTSDIEMGSNCSSTNLFWKNSSKIKHRRNKWHVLRPKKQVKE